MADVHDRVSRSRAVIAHEGWIWLAGAVLVAAVAARLGYLGVTAAMSGLTVFLFLLFRDPARVVPPLPDAIYAPLDGRVVGVEKMSGGNLDSGWWRLRVRASRLGAYTIRAPIEGTIEEIGEGAVSGALVAGLSLLSEEGDRVMLAFPGRGPLRSPKAFVRYGERLGQGERFAYLRLAPVAEIYVPDSSRLKVSDHAFIRAGDTVIAELISG